MRRAQNVDTRALKRHRLSQNVFPVCSSFVPVAITWHASRVWMRKTSEKRWFTHSQKYPDTTDAFFYIYRRLLIVTSDLFTGVWPPGKRLTDKLNGSSLSAVLPCAAWEEVRTGFNRQSAWSSEQGRDLSRSAVWHSSWPRVGVKLANPQRAKTLNSLVI